MGFIFAWWAAAFVPAVSHGSYWTVGFGLLVLAAIAVYLPEPAAWRRPARRRTAFWLAALLSSLLPVVAAGLPRQILRLAAPWSDGPILAGQGVLLLLVGLTAPPLQPHLPRAVARLRFPLALATGLVLGGLAIATVPHPTIDVYTLLAEGAAGLRHGENPYAMTFTPVADPRLAGYEDPHYHEIYAYLPGALALTLPAGLLGDVRIAMLAAVGVSASAIRRVGASSAPIRPPPISPRSPSSRRQACRTSSSRPGSSRSPSPPGSGHSAPALAGDRAGSSGSPGSSSASSSRTRSSSSGSA